MVSIAFKVNMTEVNKAAEFLGLKFPILVQQDAHLKKVYGQYCGLCFEPYRARTTVLSRQHHIIVLRGNLSVRKANRTLWHEMAHALQREREGPEFLFLYANQRKEHKSFTLSSAAAYGRYRNIPYEREAQNFEDFAQNWRLTQKSACGTLLQCLEGRTNLSDNSDWKPIASAEASVINY